MRSSSFVDAARPSSSSTSVTFTSAVAVRSASKAEKLHSARFGSINSSAPLKSQRSNEGTNTKSTLDFFLFNNQINKRFTSCWVERSGQKVIVEFIYHFNSVLLVWLWLQGKIYRGREVSSPRSPLISRNGLGSRFCCIWICSVWDRLWHKQWRALNKNLSKRRAIYILSQWNATIELIV